MTAKRVNTALGLLAIVLWSATVGLARSLAGSIGSLTAGGAVYLIGGIAGCGYLLALRVRPREYLTSFAPRYLLGCGALFVLYCFHIYTALGIAKSDTQALEAGLIHYLWPALTLLASVVLLRWRAGVLLGVGLAVATGGVWLAMTHGQTFSFHAVLGRLAASPMVYLCALVAAVCWALYSALSRKWGGEGGAGAVPLFMLATGAVLLSLSIIAGESRQWSQRVVLELIALGIAPNLGYVFWDRAMRGGDLVLVAACSYFTPLLSIVFACVYLGVLPGWGLWVGCLLVALGAVVCRASIRPPVQ
jgi:drug/metabolite transporter (DMT)-like permease